MAKREKLGFTSSYCHRKYWPGNVIPAACISVLYEHVSAVGHSNVSIATTMSQQDATLVPLMKLLTPDPD